MKNINLNRALLVLGATLFTATLMHGAAGASADAISNSLGQLLKKPDVQSLATSREHAFENRDILENLQTAKMLAGIGSADAAQIHLNNAAQISDRIGNASLAAGIQKAKRGESQ